MLINTGIGVIVKAAKDRLVQVNRNIDGYRQAAGYSKVPGAKDRLEKARIDVIVAEREYEAAKKALELLESEKEELQTWIEANGVRE